jgi:hypothetical protein
MTATLEEDEWSAARPGRTLPPGKTRYPYYRRLGGPQGRFGRAENLVLTGIRSRTVQPIVSRYTDWATGPTFELLPTKYLWQSHISSRLSNLSAKNITVKVPQIQQIFRRSSLVPSDRGSDELKGESHHLHLMQYIQTLCIYLQYIYTMDLYMS